MARNNGVFYFTVVLIVVTSGLFFAFDSPYLYEKVSPAVPLIGAWLFIFVMSTLLRTAFSDPGIVPRASAEEAAYIEKTLETPNQDSQTYRPPPRVKEISINGQTVKLKFCFTCKIFRPPRASHCSMCDNCVERFDHHCPWVGNCVGKRNYKFFFMFLVSLSIYCCYLFAFVVTHLVMLSQGEDNSFISAMKQSPASILEAIICFFSIWSIVGLTGFHSYLVGSNQTTNEDVSSPLVLSNVRKVKPCPFRTITEYLKAFVLKLLVAQFLKVSCSKIVTGCLFIKKIQKSVACGIQALLGHNRDPTLKFLIFLVLCW